MRSLSLHVFRSNERLPLSLTDRACVLSLEPTAQRGTHVAIRDAHAGINGIQSAFARLDGTGRQEIAFRSSLRAHIAISIEQAQRHERGYSPREVGGKTPPNKPLAHLIGRIFEFVKFITATILREFSRLGRAERNRRAREGGGECGRKV